MAVHIGFEMGRYPLLLVNVHLPKLKSTVCPLMTGIAGSTPLQAMRQVANDLLRSKEPSTPGHASSGQ